MAFQLGRKTASGQMAKKWPLLASSSSSRIDLRFEKVSLSGPEGIEGREKKTRICSAVLSGKKSTIFART